MLVQKRVQAAQYVDQISTFNPPKFCPNNAYSFNNQYSYENKDGANNALMPCVVGTLDRYLASRSLD
jgi:hypothetical protein